MLVRRSNQAEPHFHLCLYGKGGTGKTKTFVDFHKAGQSICVVADYESDLTLDLHGIDCPIITPRNEAELRAIVEQPQHVIDKVIKPNGFPDYEVKAFCWDIFKDIQEILFGNPERKPEPVFDGAFNLEGKKRAGILQFSERPEIQHWGALDRKTRSLVKAIGRMPYHTIVTLHAGETLDASTKLKMTGDPHKDKEVPRKVTGSISVLGEKIKHDLGYLASDLFIYMEWDGERYVANPRPTKGYYARTRMAEVLSKPFDWTGKSMYEILRRKYEEAKKDL